MNVMSDDAGRFVALIDWGDAGWGDPALELAELPVEAWRLALDGYEAAGGELGDHPESLMLWQRIDRALLHLAEATPRAARYDELVRLAAAPPPRWRPWIVG